MEECETGAVFESEVIQNILNYKWRLTKKYAYIQSALVLIFAIMLFLHTEYGRQDTAYLVPLGFFGILFGIVETI